MSNPKAVFAQQFSFSFPSREADSAHQGVLRVPQGTVMHRNWSLIFGARVPRLQSWSGTSS